MLPILLLRRGAGRGAVGVFSLHSSALFSGSTTVFELLDKAPMLAMMLAEGRSQDGKAGMLKEDGTSVTGQRCGNVGMLSGHEVLRREEVVEFTHVSLAVHERWSGKEPCFYTGRDFERSILALPLYAIMEKGASKNRSLLAELAC